MHSRYSQKRTKIVRVTNNSARWIVNQFRCRLRSSLFHEGYVTSTGVMLVGGNICLTRSTSYIDVLHVAGAPIKADRADMYASMSCRGHNSELYIPLRWTCPTEYIENIHACFSDRKPSPLCRPELDFSLEVVAST